jgi:hypothetical protein
VTTVVRLGEVSCPSGELVLMDGGYLGLWSGDRPPEEVQSAGARPGVDAEVVGPDADTAAASFGRQAGRRLYDIPRDAIARVTSMVDDHCREHALNASLLPFPEQIPHRSRVRHAIQTGTPGVLLFGVPIVAVGGLPPDRMLPVLAAPTGEGQWQYIRVEISDAPAVDHRALGRIGIDCARLAVADADALGAWIHDDPVDGLADVVFWGRDEDTVAEEFDAHRTGTPGDDVYGWLNLPIREAYQQAVRLQDRQNTEPARRFAFDFRPHSHHWQVMADVRGSDHEAATIEVGGSRMLFAMTTVGDGFFPVDVELDRAGNPAAIQITIQGNPH